MIPTSPAMMPTSDRRSCISASAAAREANSHEQIKTFDLEAECSDSNRGSHLSEKCPLIGGMRCRSGSSNRAPFRFTPSAKKRLHNVPRNCNGYAILLIRFIFLLEIIAEHGVIR